jgi:hypothetical protein
MLVSPPDNQGGTRGRMAASTQSVHDFSHVESACPDSTNNNNITTRFVSKDSKRGVNI